MLAFICFKSQTESNAITKDKNLVIDLAVFCFFVFLKKKLHLLLLFSLTQQRLRCLLKGWFWLRGSVCVCECVSAQVGCRAIVYTLA